MTNDLPALLVTSAGSAADCPLEAPPLHSLTHQRLAQGQETPGGRVRVPRISRSLLSWVFTELPVCWFGGGAGSGAALSRRLSRKSTEPQSQAGAPEPTLAAQVEEERGCPGCSRRDTGCDTGTDRESSNNGTTPATWRAAHTCTKSFPMQSRAGMCGNPGFLPQIGCEWLLLVLSGSSEKPSAFRRRCRCKELDGGHLSQSILI